MRKYRFRLPEFDVAGMWIASLGIWFYIISRLIRKQPAMAVLLAEVIGIVMAVIGTYRLLDKILADIGEKEKRGDDNQPDD